MARTDIENAILENLYLSFFQLGGETDPSVILDKEGWELQFFWKVERGLIQNKLIEAPIGKGPRRILASGVIYAEENEIISGEIIQTNNEAKARILNVLANAHENDVSWDEFVSYQVIAEQTMLEEIVLDCNLSVLVDLGFVKKDKETGPARYLIPKRIYRQLRKDVPSGDFPTQILTRTVANFSIVTINNSADFNIGGDMNINIEVAGDIIGHDKTTSTPSTPDEE